VRLARLRRLNNQPLGDQSGLSLERIALLEPLLERVYCEMSPGSALLFDCNLLHASASNESDKARRSFMMCYNALHSLRLGHDAADEIGSCPTNDEGTILKLR